MRTQQDTVQTSTRGTSELLRDNMKATKNRSEGVFKAARCTTGVRTAHREGLGVSAGWPRDAFVRLLPALGSLGLPKIGFGAAFGCPKAVPSVSGRIPETTLGAQNTSRLIFRRFWIGLWWIFVDFRTICRRYSPEPRATKARQQNFTKDDGNC